ncbi:hypothetical protein PPERSA_11178 [Pseudocohnilembus persalinus]|uniref:Transmembrane protein n=1 Tax=Pseudocohnilembus persalinus TaxID=266149 RepID=A0A0V0QZY4_PSEPJ|nr:hypothetical protein PPERSA_11178 [Pseudocohnilembus persalinus]|eukprot:KRX07629.1 hypothetical protein PPERSA_11178 [Pseudocohnilembus persalinus]
MKLYFIFVIIIALSFIDSVEASNPYDCEYWGYRYCTDYWGGCVYYDSNCAVPSVDGCYYCSIYSSYANDYYCGGYWDCVDFWDSWVFYVVLGCIGLLVLVLVIVIISKKKKQQQAAQRQQLLANQQQATMNQNYYA